MDKYILVFIYLLIIGCDKDAYLHQFQEEHSIATNLCIVSLCAGPTGFIRCRELLADNVSRAHIRVYVPTGIEEEKNSIKISSSKGIFSESGTREVTLRADRISQGRNEDTIGCPSFRRYAQATLVSTNVDSVTVITTEVDRFKRTSIIEFKNAAYEELTISADKFLVNATFADQVTITLRASRNKGMPTAGQIVKFRFVLPNGIDITSLVRQTNQSLAIDSAGMSSTTASFGDIDFKGDIFCIGENLAGTVSDTLQLRIN